MNEINLNNMTFMPLRYGQEYEIYHEAKPEYFTSAMSIPDRSIDLLAELANDYRWKNDDAIISELIDLRKKYGQVLANMDYDAMFEIQTKRQNLTNAYALNHGVGLSIIKQISMLEIENLKNQLYLLCLFSVFRWQFNNNHLAKQNAIYYYSDKDSFSSYLRFIEQEAKIIFIDSIYRQFELRDDHYQIGRLIEDPFIDNLALCAAEEKFKSMAGEHNYEKLCDCFNNVNRCIRDMKKDCQFPPYGVALAINYEDEGNGILPWHGKLSEHTISKLRLKMHAYADSQVNAYNAILAAYCNMCFNEKPPIAIVRLEFENVPHNKGAYSRDTSKQFSTYKRYVEQGWTTQIDNLVINEPFYSLYCELKEILKST